MWIFLNNAALSIVQDRNDHDDLLVRSRVKGDIERIFPDSVVHVTDDADYWYRAFVPRIAVAKAIERQVMRINYGNFKDSVQEEHRKMRYLDIWQLWRDLCDTPWMNRWYEKRTTNGFAEVSPALKAEMAREET